VKPIETSVMFDMRAPAFGTPPAELYAEALNMAAFADEIGVYYAAIERAKVLAV
jgi:hypothetical protein